MVSNRRDKIITCNEYFYSVTAVYVKGVSLSILSTSTCLKCF